LRQLQQLLSQALAQGAPQDVIDALLERYREALQRYLQALAQNAQQSGRHAAQRQDAQHQRRTISRQAAQGDRADGAIGLAPKRRRKMLAMLQSLLENLHMTRAAGRAARRRQGDVGDAIQGLGDLMGRQRQLLDKTYRQGQGAGDPKDGGGNGLAEQQGKLRDDLDKIAKGLGAQKIPQPGPLGEAQRQMGERTESSWGRVRLMVPVRRRKARWTPCGVLPTRLAQQMMTTQWPRARNEAARAMSDPLGRAEGSRAVASTAAM
jgi:hypothetical protein